MERISCTDYKFGILTIKYIPIIMFLIMWFGYIVEELRTLMFIIGTILFFLLLLKFKKYRYKCCILRD